MQRQGEHPHRGKDGGPGWYVSVKATGVHNHAVTEHQRYNYAENRKVTDPELTKDVEEMHKAGAHTQGILQYLRKKTGEFGLDSVSFLCIAISIIGSCVGRKTNNHSGRAQHDPGDEGNGERRA